MARPDDVRVSKFLALVLRHDPDRIGLPLDEHGWADVDTLLRQSAAHGMTITEDDLRRVVATNSKQRYLLDEDRRRIRANQGHSIAVDLGLTPREPPVELYHGTAQRNVSTILAEGLRPMKRRHVHLLGDTETALNGVWLVAHVPPQHLRVAPAS